MKGLIFHLAMLRGKTPISAKYGKPFWLRFRRRSKLLFRELAPQLPDLGKSLFAFNFQFAPAYAAWYLALAEMQLNTESINQIIWLLNERLVTRIPRPLPCTRQAKPISTGSAARLPRIWHASNGASCTRGTG